MTRSMFNFLIDLMTATVMLGIVATGLLIHFVLPVGSGSRRFVWGLARHDWGNVHFWLAITAIAIVGLHLTLHWQWVCMMTAKLLGRKNGVQGVLARQLAGAGAILGLLLLCGGFLWLTQKSVTEVSTTVRMHAGWQENCGSAGVEPITQRQATQEPLVQGSMTLQEVAEQTSMSLPRVYAALELPQSLRSGERLGRVAREHGFSVRQAREKLMNEPKLAGAE